MSDTSYASSQSVWATGKRNVNTSQPAFSAYNSTTRSNVTGDGTDYTLIFNTEIFDNDSNYNTTTGIFTAPVTGRYFLCSSISFSGLTSSHTSSFGRFVTTARYYGFCGGSPWAQSNNSAQMIMHGSCIADMTAGDTAYVVFSVYNGTKVVDIAATAVETYYSGFLIC